MGSAARPEVVSRNAKEARYPHPLFVPQGIANAKQNDNDNSARIHYIRWGKSVGAKCRSWLPWARGSLQIDLNVLGLQLGCPEDPIPHTLSQILQRASRFSQWNIPEFLSQSSFFGL